MNETTSGDAHIAHIDGVVVIGGGYAGLHAARAAAHRGVAVTVVDRAARHDFVTRLAGVAGGSEPTEAASTDLHQFGHDVKIGTIVGVGDGSFDMIDGSSWSADAVVVSAGATPTQPPIDGLEHALPLRTADDALGVRAALDDASALIVIGGGPTGVQLAGAASSAHPQLDVHLVESSGRILASMGRDVGVGAQRILEDRNVTVHLETEVEKITPAGAVVGDEHIDGVVVWAGGFEARSDGLGLDVSGEGRILVDDQLRVLGMGKTFAVGDVAAHLDTDGTFLPMSAQIAVQAGKAAGNNAARSILGEALDTPKLVQRGWVLDLGGGRGLAEFGPVTLARPMLDLIPPILHRLIDVKTLFGTGGFDAVRRDAI